MSQVTFDTILENKVKFGKYQYIAFSILALVDLTDGVELLTMSVLMPILQTEWKISDTTIEITTSSFYLGMFAGAIITGRIADMYGRKRTIILACFFQFAVSLWFSFINSEISLIILRFLYGVCYGFSLPITISHIAEISTKDLRGKIIICMNFCVSIGKIYGLFLIYICLNDFHSGNWRLMMIISAFTSLIVAIGNWYYLKESPRYYIASGLINEGVETLDYIGNTNNPDYVNIDCDEVKGLILYQRQEFNLDDKSNYKALFRPEMIGITLRLWAIWFALIFIEFGQYAILPFIISSGGAGFGTYLFAILGELPSIFFSLYVVDKENFGRKNTLTYCLILVSLLNLIIYFCKDTLLGFNVFCERFLMKCCFSMLIPLTSEVYPTLYRVIGYGWASGCGRVAGFLSPFILFKLYRFDTFSPFLAFLVICLIATYSSHTLPYDTIGLHLDEKREKLFTSSDKIEINRRFSGFIIDKQVELSEVKK